MSVKILTKQPKYPPIKDSNQVCYMLLHLGVPSNVHPPPSIRHLKGIKSAQEAGKSIGIKVWPLLITWKEHQGYFRYFFCFPRFKRDDKRAMLIAESVLYAVSITCGPIIGSNEFMPVFRVPAGLTRNEKSIPIDKLLQVEETRPFSEKTLDFPANSLGNVVCTIYDRIDAAWKIAPVIYFDEPSRRAARFLKTSQDDFYVWPGQIDEVEGNPDLSAITGFEQSKLENALQNAFKAVEAVLGDPPKNDNKFFERIRSIGLDPFEEVGYTAKLPLHKVIRDMNEARDKKASHGSTPQRAITIGEMTEYQACAHLVVWARIENKLGQPIYVFYESS